MKVYIGLFLVLSLVKESICGGQTASISSGDLITHGQASDILSGFSVRMLATLQDLSDHLNDIARHRDDPNFKKINGRALKSGDLLKNATKEKLEIAFAEFTDNISNLVDVNPATVKDILDNSPPLSRDVAKIQEFIKTGKLLFDSAIRVIDGKQEEFLIQFINKKQAESLNFNLSGC